MFCSHSAWKALCLLTASAGNVQTCCSPEMNYMINLKEGGKWVMKEVPGVEGQGGWGFQTRSLEWWRTLMNGPEHAANTGLCEWDSADNHPRTETLMSHLDLWPAGQLFAEQRCAAVLQSPWTPSGLLWRGRCCWVEEKEAMKVNWALPGNSCLPVRSSSPGCGRVLDQPSPLFRQLGQDCHPGLAWEGCGQEKHTKQDRNTFFK